MDQLWAVMFAPAEASNVGASDVAVAKAAHGSALAGSGHDAHVMVAAAQRAALPARQRHTGRPRILNK
jgi:hypothetical protein